MKIGTMSQEGKLKMVHQSRTTRHLNVGEISWWSVTKDYKPQYSVMVRMQETGLRFYSIRDKNDAVVPRGSRTDRSIRAYLDKYYGNTNSY